MYVVVFRYGTVFRADGESREVRADGDTLGEGETVILSHHHPGEERVSRADCVDDPHFFEAAVRAGWVSQEQDGARMPYVPTNQGAAFFDCVVEPAV